MQREPRAKASSASQLGIHSDDSLRQCYEGGDLAYGKVLRKPIGGGLVTRLGNRYCVLSEQCKGSDNRRTTMGAKGGVKELCADRGFKAREGGTRTITLILFHIPGRLEVSPLHGLFPANPLLTTLVPDTSLHPFYRTLSFSLALSIAFRFLWCFGHWKPRPTLVTHFPHSHLPPTDMLPPRACES